MWRLTAVSLILGCLQAIQAKQAPKLLLNDGNSIPVIALGTGRGTAQSHETVEQVRHAVLWAIEAGYRHIDTAAIYGDEAEVGQGIADAIKKGIVKREDLFVTTKLWSDKHARNQVVPALQESLKQLGLAYVDLYLIHFPVAVKEDDSPDSIDYLETWQGMEDARRLGLVKSIGVSNFNSSQLKRLHDHSEVKPAVNQIEVNPTNTQIPQVTLAKRLGVQIMAFSPFGFLVSRKSEGAPPPRADDPVLVQMARKYGKTTSQIVLRYLIDRNLIPIPKSTNKDRLKQNIDLFDFTLTAEEQVAIGRFNKDVRVIKFSDWKDYPNFPFEKNSA